MTQSVLWSDTVTLPVWTDMGTAKSRDASRTWSSEEEKTSTLLKSNSFCTHTQKFRKPRSIILTRYIYTWYINYVFTCSSVIIFIQYSFYHFMLKKAKWSSYFLSCFPVQINILKSRQICFRSKIRNINTFTSQKLLNFYVFLKKPLLLTKPAFIWSKEQQKQ